MMYLFYLLRFENDIYQDGGTLVVWNYPSAMPSVEPSVEPSKQPSKKPSAKPSSKPSTKPSSKPSAMPLVKPSMLPSSTPSEQPSSNPSSSFIPSSTPSAVPSVRPSTVSTTCKWVLYNANLDFNITTIKMDQTFRFTSIGTNILSVRIETPSNTRRVVFSWRENKTTVTSTDNTFPFYMGQSTGEDAFPVKYLSTNGIKTVTATVTSKAGKLIGTSTIKFMMVR
jgi:PT repeat